MLRKQAMLIIAHNQFTLLKLLLEQLDNISVDIYLHIDNKKVDIDELKDCCKLSRVFIFRSQIHVRWGAFSLIQCELYLLEKAIKVHYTYYHLISGVDFPLKNVNDIVDFFFDSDEEFVDFAPDTDSSYLRHRMSYYYFFTQLWGRKGARIDAALIPLQHVLKIDRLKNSDLTIGKGGNWFSITDGLAKEICEKKSWIFHYFKYSSCCDEVFIQTIILNSKQSYKISTEGAKRFIDWNRGMPYVFRKQDFYMLKDSMDVFARKFDYEKFPEVVDLLIDKYGK